MSDIEGLRRLVEEPSNYFQFRFMVVPVGGLTSAPLPIGAIEAMMTNIEGRGACPKEVFERTLALHIRHVKNVHRGQFTGDQIELGIDILYLLLSSPVVGETIRKQIREKAAAKEQIRLIWVVKTAKRGGFVAVCDEFPRVRSELDNIAEVDGHMSVLKMGADTILDIVNAMDYEEILRQVGRS